LDSLLDRWLSNRQASTSAPDSSSNGSSNSNSSGQLLRDSSRQGANGGDDVAVISSAQAAALWESVLGPVSITLDSLSTLEVCETRECIYCYQQVMSPNLTGVEQLQLPAVWLLLCWYLP
jgi:hypothetical protein